MPNPALTAAPTAMTPPPTNTSVQSMRAVSRARVAKWRTPQGAEWLVLVAIGALGSLGQLVLTGAYAHAPAARVGPFVYSSVVFAGLLDWALWRSIPDALALAGTALVVAAGVLALRHGAEPPQPAP